MSAIMPAGLDEVSAARHLESRKFEHRVGARPSVHLAGDTVSKLRRRDTWLVAFWTLVVMIRNVAASMLIAWFANFLFSRGNLVASLTEQSHAMFLTAVLLLTYSLCSILNLVLQATRLLATRFARAPERRPSALFCMWRVLRASYLHYLVSGVCLVGVGIGCGHLPVSLRPYKPEFYIVSVFTQYYYSVTDLAARRIYREETVHGQQKQAAAHTLAQVEATAAATAAAATADEIRVAAAPSSNNIAQMRSKKRSLRQVCRVFLQNLPTLLSIFVAGGYVHIVSQSDFSQGMQMLAFVVVSMALKLGIQELAKHYVMRRNVRHLRGMCIVVGIPTVLINTQVRVVLLSMQDAQSTMLGTWLLAALEVVLRLSKVLLLRWQVRRKRLASLQHAAVPSPAAVAPLALAWKQPQAAATTMVTQIMAASSHANYTTSADDANNLNVPTGADAATSTVHNLQPAENCKDSKSANALRANKMTNKWSNTANTDANNNLSAYATAAKAKNAIADANANKVKDATKDAKNTNNNAKNTNKNTKNANKNTTNDKKDANITTKNANNGSDGSDTMTNSDTKEQFRAWRVQMLALHTAEIYADMYAEYIAIGCSASIYYFFAGHPQYKLGIANGFRSDTGDAAAAAVAAATAMADQFVLLLLQVGIEIVVDYVSCVVEIINGIDFENFDGFGVFLGSLFTVTSLLNISMSAVLYIAPT